MTRPPPAVPVTSVVGELGLRGLELLLHLLRLLHQLLHVRLRRRTAPPRCVTVISSPGRRLQRRPPAGSIPFANAERRARARRRRAVGADMTHAVRGDARASPSSWVGQRWAGRGGHRPAGRAELPGRGDLPHTGIGGAGAGARNDTAPPSVRSPARTSAMPAPRAKTYAAARTGPTGRSDTVVYAAGPHVAAWCHLVRRVKPASTMRHPTQ